MFKDTNADLLFKALKSNSDVSIISDVYDKDSYFCQVQNKIFLVRGKSLPLNSLSTIRITKSKLLSKFAFERAGIPTPPCLNFVNDEGLAFQNCTSRIREFISSHNKVIAKPTNGSESLFIFPDITSIRQAEVAWKAIMEETEDEQKRYSGIIFEQQVEGDLYRLTFIGGKLFAVAKRDFAHIIGDGGRSVLELVDELNDYYLNQRIQLTNKWIDLSSDEVKRKLKRQGVDVATILNKGQRIIFTDIPNPDFVTNIPLGINGSVVSELEGFCGVIDLQYGGFDILTNNLKSSSYTVVEMNGLPDLDFHHFPDAGEPVDVATEMVKVLVRRLQI